MASLKARRCEALLCDLALVFFVGEGPKGRKLLEDNSSSVGASASSRIMGSFPLLQGTGWRPRPLSCTSLPPRSHPFSTWALTGRSHAAGVQHDPVAPSSTLLAPPVSSPCPDANGGIDLLAIGSLD